jgi:hypothetical protein
VNLAEKLVMRPIGALAPYASNSRTHTPEQKISKIARNVAAFGFTNRILGPRSVCARLYVVRPHQVFGAEAAFAETARFIKVSALIR